MNRNFKLPNPNFELIMAKIPKAIKLKNAKKHIKKERGISFVEITLLPPDYV